MSGVGSGMPCVCLCNGSMWGVYVICAVRLVCVDMCMVFVLCKQGMIMVYVWCLWHVCMVHVCYLYGVWVFMCVACVSGVCV